MTSINTLVTLLEAFFADKHAYRHKGIASHLLRMRTWGNNG